MNSSVEFLIWAALLVWNFCVSVWNAYAAGYNVKMLEEKTGILNSFLRIGAVSALIMGFVGTAYIVISVGGIIAFFANYLSISGLTLLYDFTFVIAGAVIVFFGMIITIHAIVLTTITKSRVGILVSIYDVIASVWNTALYVREAPLAVEEIVSETKEVKENEIGIIVVIVVVAIVASVVITYLAFRAGARQAASFAPP